MQEDRGIIYGLVGVIGSGKSYRAEQIQIDSKAENRPCIVGDFSEGIRVFLLNLFGTTECSMNITSKVYLDWKNTDQKFSYPVGNSLVTSPINGRELLQRAGEYIKKLAGDDVWANWTAKDVIRKWQLLPSVQDGLDANVVFGSLRFIEEAYAVFEVGKRLRKEVRIIFCNYKSGSYELNDHVSEKLARYFVDKDYDDGDDITFEISKMLADYEELYRVSE